MIEVFNFIYKQTNKVNMSRLSIQVLIIAPNKPQLNQNGLLKFQTGQLEKKILYSLHQLPAAFCVIVTKFTCRYSQFTFSFQLIMYVLERT